MWKSESILADGVTSSEDLLTLVHSSLGPELQRHTLQDRMAHASRNRTQIQRAVSKPNNHHSQYSTNPKHSGIPPNETGPGSAYTVPAIQMPDDTPVMDSAAIASKLEKDYPNPPLHLDNGLPEKLGPILGKAVGPILPVFMPRIGRDIIVEDCYDWFQAARAKLFGMPLDELEKTKGGDQAWEASKPGLIELKDFVKEHKRDDGPFVLGSQVCYADFLIAASMEALRRIGGDLYDKLVDLSGDDSLRKLHEACQKWMKDDQ